MALNSTFLYVNCDSTNCLRTFFFSLFLYEHFYKTQSSQMFSISLSHNKIYRFNQIYSKHLYQLGKVFVVNLLATHLLQFMTDAKTPPRRQMQTGHWVK